MTTPDAAGAPAERDRRWLASAGIAPEVAALRPDYVAVLLVADGLTPGPGDAVSEAALAGAERRARAVLAERGLDEQDQVLAWRQAYRDFGAKPQRTRPSMEALLRRVEDGLPRIDRVTDAYNAVSVAHLLPLGGEDADTYSGAPRLVRASGDEAFETVAAGEPAVEHPAAGEVVWRDDDGVTCRRWNWRQCTRTRITTATRRALFIVDALGADAEQQAQAAASELTAELRRAHPGATLTTRVLSASPTTEEPSC